MKKLLALLALVAFPAYAALTSTQLATFKTDAQGSAVSAQYAAGGFANDQAVADYYNTATTFDCWRDNVTVRETGQAFNGTEWAGMTGTNHTRLQTVAQYLATYDAGKADIRAMFNDIWSGAGGTTTRANLLTLWKTKATRLQKLLAADGDADSVWNSEISCGPNGYKISPAEVSTSR